jgi:hypothetical protein
MNVYCQDCKYFKNIECIHQSNWIRKSDFWGHEFIDYNENPEDINKKLNCKWFKAKLFKKYKYKYLKYNNDNGKLSIYEESA